MSDSEDDFMSDKFLVEAPSKASSSSSSSKTYSQRRSAQQLQSMRKSQANQKLSVKQSEEQRRKEGLNTSLFDRLGGESVDSSTLTNGQSGASGSASSAPVRPAGGAMGMMMKMGWKVGEGLGKKRSASPEADGVKKAKVDGDKPNSRPPTGRTEPIRVSLWAGRKGLSARSPSPPPLPTHQTPDALDPRKLARLTSETEDFRERQRRNFGERETERKEARAREMLIQYDLDKGIKFHPLHVLPSDPLATLPRPLLRLIYPAQALSPTPSRSPSPPPIISHEKEENVSAAQRMRDQIRRDMLSNIEGDEDELAFGATARNGNDSSKSATETDPKVDYTGVDWESMVSGTKRVLSMDPATHLEFLLSQLRHEHFFCFWCAFKYSSFEEMEAPGGCPGPDEDDH